MSDDLHEINKIYGETKFDKLLEKLQSLHEHPARVLGFDIAFDGQIKNYFKQLIAFGENIGNITHEDNFFAARHDISEIMDKAVGLYYSGDLTNSLVEAEKVLMYLHNWVKDMLPSKISELKEIV